jgi:Tfp pilus assembly protein PilE
MIVVAIIGMLVMISYPAFIRARQAAQLTSCLDKLRQIHAAKAQYALENNKRSGEAVAQVDIEPYLKRPSVVFIEPTSGTFDIQPVGSDPVCTHYAPMGHPSTI